MKREEAISRIQQALSVPNRLQGLVLIDEESANMAIEALSKLPNDEWKYKEKDGNPKEMGTYYCLVVAPSEYNGKTIPYYEYDLRWFGEGETAQAWKMDGQPDSGLVWTEQTGSMQGEQVYAWRELPDISNCLVDPQAFERLCKIK